MLSVQVEGESGPITLTDELDSGTGGTAYGHSSKPGQVIKIWHDPTDKECRKLEAILGSPPVVPSGLTQIARPLKRVKLVPSGQVAGFTMPRASGSPLADIVNPASRPLSYQNYRRRLQLVAKLTKAVDRLNRQGFILFDGLDPQNVIVGPELWLIDTDGWQISVNGTVHHAEAVHAEICPPQLMGMDICTATLNEKHDAWVLATVVIWTITGHHPFAAKLKTQTGPQLQDRIARGLWPHSRRARRHGVQPHPGAPLELLHPAMRRLAVECFDAGSLDPTARPRATDWSATIQRALADKTFLDQIPGIEAAAVRKQMASLGGSMAGRNFRANGRGTSHGKKRPRLKLAMAAMTVVLVMAIGVGYYAVVDHDKPRFVPPTGAVYQGEPRPTPEIWKSVLSSSDGVSNPQESRRPHELDSYKPTPTSWKRLHDPYLRR